MAVSLPPDRRQRLIRRRRAMSALAVLSLVVASCGSGADPALESTAGVLDASESELVSSTETTVEARASRDEAATAEAPGVPLPPTVAGGSADDAAPDTPAPAESVTGDEAAGEAAAAPETPAPAAAAAPAAVEPAPKAPAADPTPAPTTPAPTTVTTAAPTSTTTTTAAPATNSFPAVQVIDISNGNSINFSSRLAGDGRPVLLWFWSPF